jgi:hypothetical protein
MIRITKLIGRDKIFDYLNNPKVCKVELNNRENKGLKNPYVCRIYLYLDTQIKSSQQDDIATIFGQCRKYGLMQLGKGSNSFLKGICGQEKLGWLSRTHINKLIEIEKKENICFSIPKYFHDLIDKFEDKK